MEQDLEEKRARLAAERISKRKTAETALRSESG